MEMQPDPPLAPWSGSVTEAMGMPISDWHRPVWPLGLCAGHRDATPWPCEPAVVDLVEKYGTGWVLAARLWDVLEEAALLMPTADVLDLRELAISRPLRAVEAWQASRLSEAA